MNFDVLRQKILEKAICGQLVPQSESEPEVAQIGKTQDDVPFTVPEKWKWVRVSDVACINPKVIATDSNINVSFIPMAAVAAGYLNKISLEEERPWNTVKNGYTKFANGDILIAKITPCFQNRKSAIANNLISGTGCGSSEFHVLRPNESIVDRNYLFVFMKSPWFISYGIENFKGTAGQQRLGTSELKNCRFPLPPISEQQRIVEKIKKLFEQIDRAEKAYKELSGPLSERFRQLCLEKAIQGRLVPQLESEPEVEQIGEAPEDVPFAIPEKWKWVKLENLGRWKSGGTPSRSHREYYENGTIPWLKTGDLNDGVIQSVGEYITNLGLDNSSAHINPAGSVLIAMYGATIGKVGILQFPCATNQACCACVLKESICDQWYLFYFLLSQRKSFIALGAGGAQPNISRTKIVNSWIPLPPLEEQRRIVDKLTELLNIARPLENSASIP